MKSPSTHKGERCPDCKDKIAELLEKAYGKVERGYNFNVKPTLDSFKETPYYETLKNIYESLQKLRGHKDFVRAKKLDKCDYVILDKNGNPERIVEFDESQHFTVPRKIALKQYPSCLPLDFDREKWIKLCEKINAKDNNPPYRDEQRAWYDTIRDFLPEILGLKPTVRLYAKERVWCELNPDDLNDIEKFKEIIEGRRKNMRWKIELRKEENPFLARIIIAGKWEGSPEHARMLLEDVCSESPKGIKVKFLITCGGFIQFDWPAHISQKDIGDLENPNKEVIDSLIREAEKCVKSLLTPDLQKKLKEITDYITLGMDSYQFPGNNRPNINKPHIELVCLVDLRNNEFYWTGKSYPRSNQRKGLLQIKDYKTHFVHLKDVGKVMILGCHDLTIFNNRNKKGTRGWRKKIKDDFRELTKKEKPEIVLQHPHTTVKVKTWQNGWSYLRENVPSLRIYASAGRYYDEESENDDKNKNKKKKKEKKRYDELDKVLKATKSCETIDFIICPNKTSYSV